MSLCSPVLPDGEQLPMEGATLTQLGDVSSANTDAPEKLTARFVRRTYVVFVNADIIHMTSRRDSRISRKLRKSVADAVRRRTCRPVLVVPHPHDGDPDRVAV